tara:strand:+ start:1515 stop:2015 length:501 start_codon:yes stop_codon:yes gene_type:complete
MTIPSTYDDLIEKAAKLYFPEHDWRLFKAQIWHESGFKPAAKSPVGAEGLAQFMLPTWLEWRGKAGFPTHDRKDPRASVFTGACYMKYQISQWTSPRPAMDRYCLAAAAYNTGLGRLLESQRIARGAYPYSKIIEKLPQVSPDGYQETTNYVRRILKTYGELVTGE